MSTEQQTTDNQGQNTTEADTTPTTTEFAEHCAEMLNEDERAETLDMAVVAYALKVPESTITKWIMDTGCGVDLVSSKDVERLEGLVVKSGNEPHFATAVGGHSTGRAT